jgi:cell division protein FtsQ
MGIALLGGAIYVLGWSNILSVKKIEITGTSRLGIIQDSLTSSSGHLAVGKPMARVNVRVLNRTLSDISWVATESVRRNWRTGVVRIDVTERTPIAFFATGAGQRTYLDENGVQFQTPELLQSLPQIIFATSDEQVRKSVARLLSLLPPDFILGLQGVHVSSSGFIEIQVSLTGKVLTVRWGSDQDVATKIKVFRALYALPENSKASTYDVSAPTSPITK